MKKDNIVISEIFNANMSNNFFSQHEKTNEKYDLLFTNQI